MHTTLKMIKELLSYVPYGSTVLEPSAGLGDIAKRLVKEKGCIVDCVELNERNALLLSSTILYNKVVHGDFLKVCDTLPKETYDCVIAVPPYKNNVDCEHIMKMYEVVRTGGKVITFTLPMWVSGTYTNQVNFRKWLKDKYVTKIKFFEDKESYVNCPKALLIIQK